jgi:hypothetical protein
LALMAYKIKKICLNNYKISAQLEKKKWHKKKSKPPSFMLVAIKYSSTFSRFFPENTHTADCTCVYLNLML